MSLSELVTWGEPMPRTPTTRRRLISRAALATLTGLLVVAGIGCGGDDDGEDAGTDPTAAETTTTSPTTAPLTPEEEAKAVYLELVEVVYDVMTSNPDPEAPELSRLATDPLLGTLRDSLTTMQAEHHIVQRGDRTTQEVHSVTVNSPTEASMRACSVGNDTTVDRDDGSVVSGGDISTRLLDVSLTRPQAGGSWQVSDIATVEVFEGEVACPR
jgi:hypothetical protein